MRETKTFFYLKLISCLFLYVPKISALEYTLYGKIHLSTDLIQSGYGQHFALASNSSTIGIKGADPLGDWGLAIWRLESEIDASGERGYLQTRTRYAGLATQAGSLTVGVHDTPWKTLGRKFDIYDNTVFDTRALLGAGDFILLDRDATNSLQYKSPWWEDFQLDIVHSLGEEKTIEGADTTSITGISVVWKKELFTLGAVFERQELYHSDAWRGTGVLRLGSVKIGGLYERIDSPSVLQLNREAIGGNVTYAFAQGYYLHAQGCGMLNASAQKLVAVMANVGFSYIPTKSLQIYLVGGQLINDANSGYVFGLGGHGETYLLSHSGYDPFAVSIGIINKF